MKRNELDRYFARIGYSGNPRPDLATLRVLHELHPAAIAFENLDPFLSRPVRLDIESLQEKLVQSGRGGYCFEQNLLFGHVLKAIGYEVTGLAARVLWNHPQDAITPRTHMLLRIELGEGSFLADVGFGAMTLTGPLELVPHAEQQTPHEPFRLLSSGADFLLQAYIVNDWKTLYRFSLEQNFEVDYELTSWYLSNHPQSRFVTGLIASLAPPRRRYGLRNAELASHDLKSSTRRRALTSIEELRDVLTGTFRISLPDSPEVDARFAQLLESERIEGRAG